VSDFAENEAKASAVGVGILPSAAAFTKTNGFSATGAARASALVGAVAAGSSSKTEIKGRRLNSFPSIGECHFFETASGTASSKQPTARPPNKAQVVLPNKCCGTTTGGSS
jgi:hypothetical protein